VRGKRSELETKAQEWIVLQLFQEGVISAGKAAEVLGRSKADFLHLLDNHRLPYLDWALEELETEADVALAAARNA
jgi:predicted HTH domain antitoxin